MDIQIDPGAPLRSIQRPDANGPQHSRGDYKHQDANVDDLHFNRNNTPDLSETPTENWITLDFQPDLSNRSGVSQFLCFFMAHIIGSTLLFLSFSPQLSLFNLSLWLFIQLLISTPFVASLQRSIKNNQQPQSTARSARNNSTLTQENSIGAQLFRPHSANRQSHSSARNPVAFSTLEQVSIATSAVASFSLTVWAVITYLAAPSIEFTLTSTALFFALSITSLWGLRSCNERANQLRLTLYVAPLCLGLLVIWYVAATFDLPLLNNQDMNNSQWLMLYFGFVSLPVSLIIHHRYTSKINQRTQISPEQQTRINSYLQRQRQKSRYLAGQLQEESRLRKQLEQQMSANRVQMEQNVAERTRELSETNELLNQQIKLRQNISNALARSQARLSQAVEASKLGLWDWDLATDHLYQSPFHASFDKKEWSSRDFLSQLKQVTHPDDFPHVRDTLLSYINGHQENYSVRYRIFDKQLDTWIWIEDRGNAVLRNDEGKAQRIIGTRCNIHEDYQKEEQLRLTKTVFDQTSEGLFVLDHRFRFVTVNQAFKTMLGYTEDDLLGKHWMHVSQTPQKRKVFKQAQISLAETGNWEVEIFEKRANGEYFPIRIQLNTIREAHGAVAHYAGLVSDLKVHKEADEKLKYLLNYDELTGLANRSLFKDRMHSALTRARSSLSQFALLYIDIDRFKHINDSLGHEKADHILKEYSTRLAGTMNRADSVARLGDDEFAVIVSAKDLSQASLAAQDILSALSKPFNAGEEELFISSSIGITMFPSQGRELSVLMQNAASATRQAKYLGGNNFQVFSSSMQNLFKFQINVESDLRRALLKNELEVFYQPKIDLRTETITSVEALVRWKHPDKGLITPADFVNIAEETGLITDIGGKVLTIACEQAKEWLDMALGKIKISVNLSAHQLRQPQIFSSIADALEQTQLPPDLLELELTENAVVENIHSTRKLLQKFREQGISLSIDDFGTGYSSFSYLKKLPVDTLKIDRALVREVPDNPQDTAICKAIIVLGQNLNLQVVAEGVENEEQYRYLQDLGCDLVQGFYVSRPMDAEAMTKLLCQQQRKFADQSSI